MERGNRLEKRTVRQVLMEEETEKREREIRRRRRKRKNCRRFKRGRNRKKKTRLTHNQIFTVMLITAKIKNKTKY